MVVVGGCSFVLVFFFNLQHYSIVLLEMQRRFVFKDKLVCNMKTRNRLVSMATDNIILEHGVYGVHAKLAMSPLLLILDH